MTVWEAHRAWLAHLAHERRASPRTLEAYGAATQTYLVFLGAHNGEDLRLGDLGAEGRAQRPLQSRFGLPRPSRTSKDRRRHRPIGHDRHQGQCC